LSEWVNSRYNFHLPIKGGALMYNANTGALLQLRGAHARSLGRALCRPAERPPLDRTSRALTADLVTGGFCISAGHDELAEIRQRYWGARRDTPMVLTITTTMECNLACYYCYETRSHERLTTDRVASIVDMARARLAASGKRSLHVDWYGGEPLLNLDFIESASLALQALCRTEDVRYAASVISNGTSWPPDVGGFVERHRIRQVQISFDGMRRHHDRRRRYADRSSPASSFDQAVALVEALLDHVRVDLRFNIDRGNAADVLPFVRFARRRGWFARRFPAVIQPARLAAYSERSQFMRKAELRLDEYDTLRGAVRAEVAGATAVEEAEAPDGYPFPKSSVCAALASDSVVIGADGDLYRCGLQVGESGRSVGRLGGSTRIPLPLLDARPADDGPWWAAFDPTTLPTCSRCSFLPICWGGCPKKHLEGDQHAVAEQGAYWRANLPRLIASRAGQSVPPHFTFSEADQFRS
jgi:uncharacterized protein